MRSPDCLLPATLGAHLNVLCLFLTRYYSCGHIKKNDVGNVCSTHGGEKMWIHDVGMETWGKESIWKTWANTCGLKIVNSYVMRAWTGLVWLRIGKGGCVLWMRWWTFVLHKMWRISWLAEYLLASQGGLYCMELVRRLFRYVGR